MVFDTVHNVYQNFLWDDILELGLANYASTVYAISIGVHNNIGDHYLPKKKKSDACLKYIKNNATAYILKYKIFADE